MWVKVGSDLLFLSFNLGNIGGTLPFSNAVTVTRFDAKLLRSFSPCSSIELFVLVDRSI